MPTTKLTCWYYTITDTNYTHENSFQTQKRLVNWPTTSYDFTFDILLGYFYYNLCALLTRQVYTGDTSRMNLHQYICRKHYLLPYDCLPWKEHILISWYPPNGKPRLASYVNIVVRVSQSTDDDMPSWDGIYLYFLLLSRIRMKMDYTFNLVFY